MSISILTTPDKKDWLKCTVNTISMKELRLGNIEQSADSVAKKNALNELIWEPKSIETSGFFKYFIRTGENSIAGPLATWTLIPDSSWTTPILPQGDYIIETSVIFRPDGATSDLYGAVRINIDNIPVKICEHIYYPQENVYYSTATGFIKLSNTSGTLNISTVGRTGASLLYVKLVKYRLYKIKTI